MKEEQLHDHNEKSDFLGLKHEDEIRLHPHTLKHLKDWKAEIIRKVPQFSHLDVNQINEDIDTHLKDTEKEWFSKYRAEILKWLVKCMDIGNEFSPYSPVYDVWIISSMSELKKLIKTAYVRKEEKARKEEREREERRQWEEASEHVFPLALFKEAKRYLNKDEIDKLYEAAGVAIRVYLKEGDSYLNSHKTFEYRWWLKEINYRKEKEQIRLNAEVKAQSFNTRLDKGLKEIEGKLSPEKEDPAIRFKRYCLDKGESRYLGESFTDILSADDDRKDDWTRRYILAAEVKLLELIPEELRDFILTKPTAVFFLLPSANYSYCGVPCLDIYFDVFAVVTITVLAQGESKKFNGIPFGFLTNLREPKLLGFYQIAVVPIESHFWQSIPVSIVLALLGRNLQPEGITILERTEEMTAYKVNKFDMDICGIPISFERYFFSLGSIEKMKELGIIKERAAEILESPERISINHKNNKSKKAKAFALFSQGKRPNDSEVKSLGIKPESAYRYYQD